MEVFSSELDGASGYQTLSQLRDLLLGLVEAIACTKEASSLSHRYRVTTSDCVCLTEMT